MNRIALCSVVVGLLGASACKSNEPPARAPETPPAPASSAMTPTSGATIETAPQDRSTLASSNSGGNGNDSTNKTANGTQANPPNGNTATTANGMSANGGSAQAALTDDQILYVLHSANLAEMDQARMAQKKAKNTNVKHFAAMMLKDHGDADSRGNDIAKKVQASLTPSETSRRLESDAKQLTSSISAEKGSEFDRTYIDAQVKEHRALLDVIDRELTTGAKSEEVKQFVQTMGPKVKAHLEEAEKIQSSLTK